MRVSVYNEPYDEIVTTCDICDEGIIINAEHKDVCHTFLTTDGVRYLICDTCMKYFTQSRYIANKPDKIWKYSNQIFDHAFAFAKTCMDISEYELYARKKLYRMMVEAFLAGSDIENGIGRDY